MGEQEDKKLLVASGLDAGYHGKRVLSGVGIDVAKGEVVAVIGHNGAGKSTLLKALFGLVELSAGTVALRGEVWQPNPVALLAAGVAYVPQGNQVFPALTVLENLRVAHISATSKASFQQLVDGVLDVFPNLRERMGQLAGTLSGGERQMLALGRTLMFNPKVLLLDEPSLGLAPPMVITTLALIQRLANKRSMGIVVVEQKVREVLSVASRVYVLKGGSVAFQGDARQLLRDEELLREVYL